MIKPSVFGKYILLERVNVGGMAEVFRAKLLNNPTFERYFALKRILPHLAKNEEFVSMFINEATVAVELNHPNVCQIYELGRLGDSHYIAMEYIAGRDIHAIQTYYRRNRKIMSVSQACFIIAQAAQGLDYAHKAVDTKTGMPLGIIHRDVTPQNLIVTYDGVVKLIDFGVAKAAQSVASHSQSGVVKGKYSYMSPEQAKAQELDHRSDIFALGVVFWELLTGRRLFQAENEFAIIEMITSGEIEKPSKYNKTVPEIVDRICMRALEKDPNMRYPWASDMVADLFQFIESCKTQFTQWHLQQWMCSAFEKELNTEREKIAVFQSLNTEANIDQYNFEYADQIEEQEKAEKLAAEKAAEESIAMRSVSLLGKLTAESEIELQAGGNPSGAALPPVPGRGVRSPDDMSKSLPGVKSVSLPDIKLKSDAGESSARLSIDSSESKAVDDDNVELEAEGIGPNVSDPYILAMEQGKRKTRTRRSLMIFIVVLSVFFIVSPFLLLTGIVEPSMPPLNLPTDATIIIDVVPDSDDATTEIYRYPRQEDSKPIESKTGKRVEFSKLEAGKYELQVSQPGFEKETFSVNLDNGTSETRLEMTQPLNEPIPCDVEVDPPDAKIYLNGILQEGSGGNRTIDIIAGSSYSVRAFKIGYASQTLTGTAEKNMSPLKFTLESQAPTLTVLSEPQGTLFVPKKKKMVKKGDTPVVLDKFDISKPMKIEVRAAGYQDWKEEIDFDKVDTGDIRIFADLQEE